MGSNQRAQAGLIEFLVIMLLMLIITQKALILAKNTKFGGVLILERMIVERTINKLEFAIKELKFTGFGRKIIEIPEKPFINYELLLDTDIIILNAFFEDTRFNKTLNVSGVRVNCIGGTYSNLTVIVENWGDGVEVSC